MTHKHHSLVVCFTSILMLILTNNNCQGLTGGEDAYFVAENWLGVADGIGQWSLEGICSVTILSQQNISCISIVV